MTPPTIEAALVISMRRRHANLHDGEMNVTIVDRIGHKELVSSRASVNSILSRALAGTRRGELLVDLWLVNDRHITRVEFTAFPPLCAECGSAPPTPAPAGCDPGDGAGYREFCTTACSEAYTTKWMKK